MERGFDLAAIAPRPLRNGFTPQSICPGRGFS